MKYKWGVQTCIGAQALSDELNRVQSFGWEVFAVSPAGHETRAKGDPRIEEKWVDGRHVTTTLQDMEIIPVFAIVVRTVEVPA